MENHQIKLIDNTYSTSEAQELLSALINDKIRFLNQKVFSLRERLGCDTSHLEKRITELKEEKKLLLQKFKEFGDHDLKVEIDCHAYLKIKKEASVFV